MRKKHVTLNVFINAISRIIILLLGFISRKLIIKFVAIEYLGLNSLYANLLDLLNLAELGLGVAIQIRLYEPLIKKDYKKVTYLLRFAKKIYSIIGVFVLLVGLIASFFLRFIIKDNPFELWYVQIAFIISVIGISLSYLCADKRLFFESNERYYIITISDIVIRVFSIAIGLIILYFTREYLLYISITALQAFLSNLIMFILFKRKYSYCIDKDYNKNYYSEENIIIKKNLLDVVPMKLGVFVFSSTDSIVISSFLGLSFVAIYTNYNVLYVGLLSISSIVSTALVSTFGKMEKENPDRKELYRKFNIYSNLQFMFSTFTTVCILFLVNKFMYLWIGDGYYLSKICIVLLSFDYFIHSLFQPLSTIYTSTGKFKQDKICMIISAVMNLVISIILVNFIGMPGIIIGTLCANIFTYINRTIVMNKMYFSRPTIEIILKPIMQIVLLILEAIGCYYLLGLINILNPWLDFIVCGIICTIFTNIINLFLCKILGYFSLLKRRRKNEIC